MVSATDSDPGTWGRWSVGLPACVPGARQLSGRVYQEGRACACQRRLVVVESALEVATARPTNLARLVKGGFLEGARDMAGGAIALIMSLIMLCFGLWVLVSPGDVWVLGCCSGSPLPLERRN